MDLEIIINPKTMDDGQAVIQLETAAGAAVKHFKGAHGVNVPRSRFLPVKSCSDLLLIKSDIYSLEHGQLVINPSRMFDNIPVIKLGDHFKKVCSPGRANVCLSRCLTFFPFSVVQIQQFQKRFKKIPKILDLDHLTVTGDVNFGRNVTLRGTVIIVANEGQRIDIPDGCVLENRLLAGNLTMTVRALCGTYSKTHGHIFPGSVILVPRAPSLLLTSTLHVFYSLRILVPGTLLDL